MFGKWRESEPRHFWETVYLKIKYDAVQETASGFILSEKDDRDFRKYAYEAALTKSGWNIVLTAGDPLNTKSFSNRDRDPQRFRQITGLPKFHRRDISRNLEIKLATFRDKILREEKELLMLKSKGRFLREGKHRDEYWLSDDLLIRVVQSPTRDVLVALKVQDLSLDSISAYIV